MSLASAKRRDACHYFAHFFRTCTRSEVTITVSECSDSSGMAVGPAGAQSRPAPATSGHAPAGPNRSAFSAAGDTAPA
ncbi:hypothetical protein NL676_031652 [Syzygium grande]|nr:hypothetical protein NL676_031652 [Syzygium grande]